MASRKSIAERFWPKVELIPFTDCWIWNAYCDKDGYGKLTVMTDVGCYGYTQGSAHRISWELHFGPIPDGLHVLHKCDTPPCVNPRHLFLGTTQDNTADQKQKGRTLTGESNPFSKLTTADILLIRAGPKSWGRAVHIAKTLSVIPENIMMVMQKKAWAHVAITAAKPLSDVNLCENENALGPI